MFYNIAERNSIQTTSAMSDFANAVIDNHLLNRASNLRAIGIESTEDVDPVIEKAIAICLTCGIAATNHFKKIYISNDEGIVEHDWMLSNLAYMLVAINCSPLNPRVAGFQIELIKNILSK
jgi:hypothetical protein